MENIPKVLVAAPTYKGKHYIFPKWYKLITNLTYKNYDWLIVDNTRELDYYRQLKREGYKKVVHVDRGENSRQALARSSNYIREYAIKNDYDYVLMIETDLLPPLDIIERLLKHNKDVVGVLYFIGLENSKTVPKRLCLYEYNSVPNYEHMLIKMVPLEENIYYIKKGLKQVAGMGFGCTLFSKKIFSEIEYKYSNRHSLHSDTIFYLELAQKGIPVFCDTDILVPHFNQNWLEVEDR